MMESFLIDIPVVSIPKRDFIGFKRCTESLKNPRNRVSIPDRDFIGFKRVRQRNPMNISEFQSLIGIL